jgi:hypothetical protein
MSLGSLRPQQLRGNRVTAANGAEQGTAMDVPPNAFGGALLGLFHFFDNFEAGGLDFGLLPELVLAEPALDEG